MSIKILSRSIGARLLAQIFAFIVIPFTVIVLFLFIAVNNDSATRQKNFSDTVFGQIDGNIRGNIELIRHITQNVLSNNELMRFLTKPYSAGEDYGQYITLIRGYTQAIFSADYRSDIRIYPINETIPMGIGVFYPFDTILNDANVAGFINSNETNIWFSEQDFENFHNPFLFPTTERFVYLEKIFNPSLEFLGIIAFSIPERYFFHDGNVNGINVQSIGKTRFINLTNTIIDESDLIEITTVNKDYFRYNNMHLYSHYPDIFPFQIIIVVPADISVTILKIILICMAIFLSLALFTVIRSIRIVTRKMNDCISEMDESISGNFIGRLKPQGHDELSLIATRINLLLDKIADQIHLIIKKETAGKEAQLMALQHQINPHFIYNTLEVFSSKMKLNGFYSESDALVSFANIFRYNVYSHDMLVSISEELKQAENYMNIQKLSYPNITLEVTIPPELHDMKIPKFIFQPLIENSIIHGTIPKADTVSIVISATKPDDAGNVLFSISDNGRGLDVSMIKHLNETLSSDEINIKATSEDKGSIGLTNINTRLRLHYGDKTFITVHRDKGWTVIRFTVSHS